MPTDLARSLSAPIDEVQRDANVNTVSPYAAAQEAVKGFDTLPKEVKKTFFLTGNKTNVIVVPAFVSLGMSKNASWYMIQCLVESYRDLDYRFYFVDQRAADGGYTTYAQRRPDLAADAISDGEAHANYFMELVERADQGPADATFVKGKGYVKFEDWERPVLRF